MIDTEEFMDAADWAFAQIIMQPVLFREFIDESDPNLNPIEPHERAWTACYHNYLCMCCGRSVHKTTTMIEMLFYWVINNEFVPGDPGLFVVVPNKAQKDATFPRIRSACETHWLISKLVDINAINIQEGRINFLNGFTFIMRIAGSAGKETNVIAVHTYRIWVDEAQDFPYRAWLSLQNVLKDEIPGFKLIVSGVPNGERKENVLYQCDQIDQNYISFNISQTMMSWWTPEMEYKKRIDYKAQEYDSEDYKHYVLGQHGVPTYSIFDRIRFKIEDYEVHLEMLNQSMFENTRRFDPNPTEEQLEPVYHINEVFTCPEVPMEGGTRARVGLGYDVGYAPDPAVFFIMYQDPRTGLWRNLSRYILQRVEYALQREALVFLDSVYNFDFMGIDMGGPGKPQYQDLSGELNIYKSHFFKDRLFPVEFGSFVPVAKTMEIDNSGNKVEVIKKAQMKAVAVETASRWVHEHRFSFSNEDDDLMSELERTKFTRGQTGEPVYKTEDDHQFAAMMCAILAYENNFGIPLITKKEELKPRLLSARWLDSREGNFYGSN